MKQVDQENEYMKLSINGVRRSMVAALNYHADVRHITRDELIRQLFDNVYGKLEKTLQEAAAKDDPPTD